MYMCMRRDVRNGRRTDEEGGGGKERCPILGMAVGLMRGREGGGWGREKGGLNPLFPSRTY